MPEIRPAETIAEYDACEEIQRRAWGYQDIDVVPTNELISAVRAGGVVLGAFLDDGRMAGFVFGIVGREQETGLVYHYSRMVGVDPEFRGKGIAQSLKMAQRGAVMEQGLDIMRWTFEPLEAGNAMLNLRKLGAEVVGYYQNLFGDVTTSPLHQGIGTDRLMVEWRLRGPRREVDTRGPRIEIPTSIQDLKRNPSEAQRARARVRAEFEAALADGWIAVDFKDGAYGFARREQGPA
jgi:chorismate synthase